MSPRPGETPVPIAPIAPLPSSSATETGLPAARLTESIEAAPAEVVGGFRIAKQLGQGGMATVYEAFHVETGQRVALKRVREDARKDPQFIERFLREVRAASKLDHPNCCRVYAGGDDGKDVFMAVEILDGGDIDGLLFKLGGRLPASAAAVLIAELLEALDHAHTKGLVHRDIKPANVMLTSDGVVKLVDFGIARNNDDVKLTATGLVVGTPAYMSPEQAKGLPLDPRSDLFSVGVMFAELLTGENPFRGDTATATVMKILTQTLAPLHAADPTVPGIVSLVVEGLLQRDINARYPSARAALDDLAPYVRLVREQQPDLVARLLKDPAGARRALLHSQAEFELERARDLVAQGEVGLPAAALALFRATRLEPDSEVARQALADVVRQGGFDFAPSDPRIADVEAQIARSPFQPALLKRASDLHRAAKNPAGQASWLLRYLQVQPADELARRQCLTVLQGPQNTTDPGKKQLTTREIVDGVKTGGWKAAGNRTETTFRPFVENDVVGAPTPLSPQGPTTAQRRPPAPRSPPPQVQGVNSIVVVERGDEDGTNVVFKAAAAAIVVVAIAAVGYLATRTKESLETSERNRGAKLAHHLDAAPEMKVAALDALARARAAAVANNGADAVDNADQALTFAELAPDEQLEALYLKARGLELSGDKAGARLAVDDYLKKARLGHPQHADAVALEGRVR